MRGLDAAKDRLKPPTPEHEAYQVNRWTRQRGSILKPVLSTLADSDLPPCAICAGPISTGLEVAYRRKGTWYHDRQFLYVHVTCLKPIQTHFDGGSA